MTAERHPENTLITMQLGTALLLMLSVLFFSGGLFYLYVFNYDIGPYFTITRALHFYTGLASIPFLIAKYGSTGLRFAGYYLVGLTSPQPGLFEGIDWSTERVLQQTLDRARALNLRVFCLPYWYDIDTAADLDLLRRDVRPGSEIYDALQRIEAPA